MPVATAKSARTRAVCAELFDTIRTLLITSIEGGADLRYVQELLGHADPATTTIYTHVSIRQLKAVHTATHPGATNGRRSPGLDRDGDDEIAAHLDAWLNAELAEELNTDLATDDDTHD